MDTLPQLLIDVLDQGMRQSHCSAEWDESYAYYDGNQVTDEQLAMRKRYDMPDMNVNIQKEAINSVLGHEEKSRVDWLCKADDDDSTEMAEAINYELNELARMTKANHHFSEGFKGQCVPGIGWLKFERNTNPLAYRYRWYNIHRDEVIWDRRSTELDLSDARWVAHRKFMDQDAALAVLPKHRKIIDSTFSNWNDWDIMPGAMNGMDTSSSSCYEYCFEAHTRSYQAAMWMNDNHKMVALYNIFYRKTEPVQVIKYQDRRVEEFDKDNPLQLAAVMREGAKITTEFVATMREAWFVGPHLVEDKPANLPHNHFPLIPLFGYREDKTNNPYGFHRDMKGPQDAFNNANNKIHHILNSKRIFVRNNAFREKDAMTDEQLIFEINRKDGVVYLNSLDDIDVQQDWQELNKLFDLKAQAREEIRMASGINATYVGNTSNQQSGKAMENAEALSDTTLSEFLANYTHARQLGGEIMMAHVVRDIGNREHTVALKNASGQEKKKVILNARDTNNNGVTNNLQQARLYVAIADIQTSEGYREQEHNRLAGMYKDSQSEELQGVLLPVMVETSNIPNREEILANLNRQRGRGVDEAQQAEMDKQAQAAQAEKADQDRRLIEAEIRVKEAEADLAESNAEKADLEKAKIAREIQGMPTSPPEESAANDDSADKMGVVKSMRDAAAKRALRSA